MSQLSPITKNVSANLWYACLCCSCFAGRNLELQNYQSDTFMSHIQYNIIFFFQNGKENHNSSPGSILYSPGLEAWLLVNAYQHTCACLSLLNQKCVLSKTSELQMAHRDSATNFLNASVKCSYFIFQCLLLSVAGYSSFLIVIIF